MVLRAQRHEAVVGGDPCSRRRHRVEWSRSRLQEQGLPTGAERVGYGNPIWTVDPLGDDKDLGSGRRETATHLVTLPLSRERMRNG